MGKKSELEKESIEAPVEPEVEPVVVAVEKPAKVKKPRSEKQLAADEKLRQRAKDLREFKKAKEDEKLAVTTHPHKVPPTISTPPPPLPPKPKPAPAPKQKPTPAPSTPTPQATHYDYYSDNEEAPPAPKPKHYRLPRKYRMKS